MGLASGLALPPPDLSTLSNVLARTLAETQRKAAGCILIQTREPKCEEGRL
jgi:hypothetical protein